MNISKVIRLVLVVIALLVGGIGLSAQSASQTRFGDFLFKVPDGWNPVEKQDAMLLVAPAARPGAATYIVLAVGDLHGNLQESFNEFLNGIQKAYRISQSGKATPMHSQKGYDAYLTTALATDKDGKPWNLYLVGIQYGKRFEAVTFWSDLPSSDSTYGAYLDTFMAFLDDISFEGASPVPKIPSDPPQSPRDTSRQLPPGTLQGVYVSTGGADGRPSNKQYIFYPDGLMVYGIPQEGMMGFDFDHYRSESNRARNWVGRYQVDGDKVRIVWQNQFGDPARPVLIKINETSAHPAWDPGWDTFIPMCRCTGKTFSGKYRWGNPASDQYIEFFADGTFLDHRVTDQLIVPSPFYSRPRIQRGRYSIQSQTIIFSFADGHRGTRTFVAPKAQENQATFDWIGLGWQQLFEESYRARLQTN